MKNDPFRQILPVARAIPHFHRMYRSIAAVIGALALTLGLLGASSIVAPPPVAHAATLNPIQAENSLPGDPTWNDFASVAAQDAISGFGSKISVNHGDSLDLYVTTTAASFTISVYRTGWYNGDGARLISTLGPFTGVHQVIPAPNPVTGMVSCTSWTKTTTLSIPSNWVTGVYLARLNASNGNKSFIFFVVRDDGGTEPIEFQTSVTTYQAYNGWGGVSLYANNTNGTVYKYPHATKVSFDRPFDPQDSNGAGHFLYYEYPFIRWAESQGYNITYTTDVDTDTNANPLTNHKEFLSVGHDEYWSRPMRTNVQNAINAGVNVAFFSANSMYWQIRFEPNSAGVADRVEVGYKDFATATTAPGPDPMYGVNNSIVTANWRDPVINQPENGVIGVMYQDQVNKDYAYVVQNASNWVYAGTGFVNGTSLPGIVGYEYDKVWNNGFTPAGLTVLSNSPVVGCCEGSGNSDSNSSVYTAASGAQVFAGGTIQWSWGLDNYSSDGNFVNAGFQRTTSNILNKFMNGSAPPPAPAVSLSPANLTFASQTVNTTSAAQSITLTNTGNAALSISGIALSGTNAGDFAQTNTCPSGTNTLAAGANCAISVTFTPTASGTRTASVTITDNASNSPQSVGLSGTGTTVAAPAVSLSPTSLSFGSVAIGTTSAVQSVTLTNSGNAALSISNIALSGTNAADFAQTNTCPTGTNTLAAGANCAISVTFTPTQNASESASVQITDNAAGSPQSVSLSGTGYTPAPAVSLTPTSLSFGSVTTNTSSAAQSITLKNTGTAPLTISGIALSGTNADQFSQTNTCPASLAAGGTCSISVVFSPTVAQSDSASVQVSDNASGSPHSASLSGTGVAPSACTALFCDGFESGTLPGVWSSDTTGTNATLAIVSTPAHSGTHALKVSLNKSSTGSAYVTEKFTTAQPTVYVKAWFDAQATTTWGEANLISLYTSGGAFIAWVYYDPSLTNLYLYTASNKLVTCSSQLPTGAWHSLELGYTSSLLSLTMDGTSICSTSVSGLGSVGSVNVGVDTADNSLVQTFYVDDVTIDSKVI
ncbi:MAG TPA: N,N-dimethylformamidase beta subunit family domain-containing protein [Ktedonobacterales bacterium]